MVWPVTQGVVDLFVIAVKIKYLRGGCTFAFVANIDGILVI